jgi:hypothetical protein
MRSSIIHSVIVTIGAALIAAVTVPSPAAATKLSEARALCKKNQYCSETNSGPGGSLFCVTTEKDICGHVVACPPKGNCWVVYIQPGGGKKVLGGNTPANVLTGAVTATPGRPASIFTGGILDNSPGFSSTGPSRTGAPASAPAAPPGKLY